jgi:hypothetical protein
MPQVRYQRTRKHKGGFARRHPHSRGAIEVTATVSRRRLFTSKIRFADEKNPCFFLDTTLIACTIKGVRDGLFSVPAPLFGLLAGSSAGFFAAHFGTITAGP